MAGAAPAARRKVYSIRELTRDIKLHLENRFTDLWVAGELSNFKRPSSGHLYFTLKDRDSQLPAVMFRGDARYLRFKPQDGLAVLAHGHLTLYEPRGAYQLQVNRMEPRGKGALQLAFEQLKEKLAREGLFAEDRKKNLPRLPQKIGIITSPAGAALRDICRVLHRRFPNLEVVVYPAQVQGDLAAAEISKGVQVMNRLGGYDVLIVTRGGGSLEDLWPFNEESVARAIAHSRIPIISAVGHEIDFTIADFVADLRAPTPSAAAELVVSRKDTFLEYLAEQRRRLDQGVTQRLTNQKRRVERLAGNQAFLAVKHSVQLAGQRLDENRYRMDAHVTRRIGDKKARVGELGRRLEAFRLDRVIQESRRRLAHLRSLLTARETARLATARERLSRSGARLQALSPLGVLGRGYSLAWDDAGHLLRDAAKVAHGDRVRVTLQKGELHCKVERTSPGPEIGNDGEAEGL